MNDWMVAGIVLLVAGALFVWQGLPLARGTKRANRRYGFRQTRPEDEALWAPIDAMTGIALVVAGAIAVAVGGLLVVFSGNDDIAQLALGIGVPALTLWLLASVWRGWSLARRIDAWIERDRAAAASSQRTDAEVRLDE